MIDLRLTNKQAFELHDILRFLGSFGKMERGSALDEVRLKLLEKVDEIVCPWCGERPVTRKGKCHACYMKDRRKAIAS